MWLSKKALNKKLHEERTQNYRDQEELRQWDKLYKLEADLQKLKKIVKEMQ